MERIKRMIESEITNNNRKCPFCCSNIRTYKHRINIGLVNGLRSLFEFGGIGKLSELKLTQNEFNNFQKLRYWELVVKEEVNFKATNRWQITEKGFNFILDRVAIPDWVETLKKINVGESKKLVKISDYIDVNYQRIDDYVTN